MNKSLMWRGLLILGLVALAVFGALPLEKKINLGLDLRGGMYLSLRVKTEDALRSETDKDMERVRADLEDKQVKGVEARRTSDTTFELLGVPLDKGDVVRQVDRPAPIGRGQRRKQVTPQAPRTGPPVQEDEVGTFSGDLEGGRHGVHSARALS